MVRRQKAGQRIRETRQAQGLSLKALAEKIREEFRYEIGESTIRVTEQDEFSNPGIKTIEMIARGLGLPPLEIIAQYLDDPPPETTERFSRSRLAVLADVYEVLPARRKVWFDDFIEMLIDRMRKG